MDVTVSRRSRGDKAIYYAVNQAVMPWLRVTRLTITHYTCFNKIQQLAP